MIGYTDRRSWGDMIADVARQRIRHRIERGTLPRDRTIEMWHGPGFGQTCDGCGLTISTADRMSLVCADDWKLIRLHDHCFNLWDEERRPLPSEQTA